MKKNRLLGLISSVIFAYALVACQQETPEIDIPVLDTSVACLSDLNQTVNQGDSMTVTLRTYPSDLLNKNSVSLSVVNADSTAYKYMTLASKKQNADGTWELKFELIHGVKDGDLVRIAVLVEHEDKTFYTPEIVVRYIREIKGIETLEQDTVTVKEGGDSLKIHIATLPWNLLSRKNVKIQILDMRDSIYSYATPLKSTMLADSSWTVNLRPEMGLDTGDSIRISLTDPDTTLYTKPLVVKLIRIPEKFKRSIEIVSGNIAAYYVGSMAQIKIRTTPWNLFMVNDSIRFLMVGPNGESLEQTANFVLDKEIQRDSTWIVKMDLRGSLIKSDVKASMIAPDSTYFSTKTVNVKKVDMYIDGVRSGSDAFSLNEQEKTWSRRYPTITNFTEVQLTFSTYNVDKITVDGQEVSINTKKGTFDLSKPLTLSIWKYDAHKDYTLILENSGLPVVKITTPKTVKSKTEWVTGGQIEIYNARGRLMVSDTLSIRGRGNASWNDTNKKSYALKIDEKHKVLGMGKHKRWCLLANFKDRTLLRNDVTFHMAKMTSQDYVVSGQFVELELNGQYRGNYYLCEQGKIGKQRINIHDDDVTNPGESGFLLESDAYYTQESHKAYDGFISDVMKIPYAFKQPDEAEMTQPAMLKVKNFINAFEACLKDETRVKNHEYENYIDVDQCIDYALIQEMTGNQDFYNDYPVPGAHSMYFHIDSIDYGGKLKFGHLWDFDYRTYETSSSWQSEMRGSYNWVGLTMHGKKTTYDWSGMHEQPSEFYYYYLLKDNRFKTRLQERWNELKDQFLAVADDGGYIDMMADSIRVSENYNATLPNNGDGSYGWFPIVNKNGGGANQDQSKSFQSAINEMKKGLKERINWMTTAIPKL